MIINYWNKGMTAAVLKYIMQSQNILPLPEVAVTPEIITSNIYF